MIICDIDGCILENQHRAHLIPEDRTKTENWTAFNKACLSDKPIMAVVNFVKHLAEGRNEPVVFLTSRANNVRAETVQQLKECFGEMQCVLIMRSMTDDRSTIDYKSSVIEELSKCFEDWSIIIDDHPGIISMVKDKYPMLQRMLVPSYDCTVEGDSLA